MSLLVTGSTGGLGRIFVEWLQKNVSEQVWLTGRQTIVKDGYLSCDLSDLDSIGKLLRATRPHMIFHLAGSFSNIFDLDLSINVLSAKRILDLIISEHIDARVVLIGSAAEYGIVTLEENPLTEDRVLRPVSIYGLTKSFQTQLASFYASIGVDVLVARLFNLLAPGLSERLFVGRVETLIRKFQCGEIDKIEVGNLDSYRDYVTSEKAVELLNLITNKGRSGEIYHVASGKPMLMRDILHDLLYKAGLNGSIIYENRELSARVGYDVPIIYADMTKTHSLMSL